MKGAGSTGRAVKGGEVAEAKVETVEEKGEGKKGMMVLEARDLDLRLRVLETRIGTGMGTEVVGMVGAMVVAMAMVVMVMRNQVKMLVGSANPVTT